VPEKKTQIHHSAGIRSELWTKLFARRPFGHESNGRPGADIGRTVNLRICLHRSSAKPLFERVDSNFFFRFPGSGFLLTVFPVGGATAADGLLVTVGRLKIAAGGTDRAGVPWPAMRFLTGAGTVGKAPLASARF